MKIVFLSDDFPPDNLGGAGVIAQSLARGLNALGHKVFVITAVGVKEREGINKREGLTIYNIYSNYHERWRAFICIYNPQTVGKVAKILSQIKPDVVHAHNIHYHLSYHTLRIAKKNCCKVLLTAHDTLLYSYGKVRNEDKISWLAELKNYKLRYNPFRNLAIRYYLKFVDNIVAVSESLGRALKNNGIPRVTVVHNGIDIDNWQFDEKALSDFKKEYGLGAKKVVLFAGRLSWAKGMEAIIKAMARVVRERPNTSLLIAGTGGKFSQTMKNLSANSGISKNVIFTGWLNHEQMKLAYFASDVVTIPSTYLDPFPTVNLEAMAAKKPVVGTCFGGTPEAIADGFNGYIVNPNDTDVLAKKIIELLENPQKAHEFGVNGYRRAKEIFDLDKQAGNYFKLYSD